MKTKMTYVAIINNHEVLKEIGKKVFPRKVSHALSRTLGKLEAELKEYQKQLKDIADRYAAKDENGEYVYDTGPGGEQRHTFAAAEDQAAFAAEVKELLGVEVDVEVYKLRAEELEKCETSDRYDILSPVEETAIAWMIDDGD